MPDEQLAATWISLAERPPPVSKGRHRLLVWFILEDWPTPVMGWYLGDDKVQLVARNRGLQLGLELEAVTHWRPFDEAALEEFERVT